jgi:hypothetical protein
MFSYIKHIKINVWENFYLTEINFLRKAELMIVRKMAVIKFLSIISTFFTPPFIAFIVFCVLVSKKEPLNLKDSITIISFANLMRFSLSIMPKALRSF